MEKAIEKVKVLMEALPYVRRFRGKLFVIKYGGSIVANEERKKDIVQDIVFMSFVGIRPYLVHGGGPAISEAIKTAGKTSKFVNGLRITDDETLDIVQEVLVNINSELVNLVEKDGGRAIGFCEKQRRFIIAKKLAEAFGHVGEVIKVGDELLNVCRSEDGVIPVIAPIGCGEDGEILNVNADEVAANLACSIQTEKIVLITDVHGIMRDPGNEQSLVSTLRTNEVEAMIKNGIISGGMIPKVRACMKALKSGVKKAHIIDGNVSHALLLEIFTDKGIGTEIIQ